MCFELPLFNPKHRFLGLHFYQQYIFLSAGQCQVLLCTKRMTRFACCRHTEWRNELYCVISPITLTPVINQNAILKYITVNSVMFLFIPIHFLFQFHIEMYSSPKLQYNVTNTRYKIKMPSAACLNLFYHNQISC